MGGTVVFRLGVLLQTICTVYCQCPWSVMVHWPAGNTCFYTVSKATPYNESKAFCYRVGYSKVVAIDTPQEMTFLNDHVFTSNRTYWIAGVQQNSLSGAGDLGIGGQKMCRTVHFDNGESRIQATPCNERHLTVCEYPLGPPVHESSLDVPTTTTNELTRALTGKPDVATTTGVPSPTVSLDSSVSPESSSQIPQSTTREMDTTVFLKMIHFKLTTEPSTTETAPAVARVVSRMSMAVTRGASSNRGDPGTSSVMTTGGSSTSAKIDEGTSVSYLSTKEAQLSTSEITQYVSVEDEAVMSTGVPSPDSGTQGTSVSYLSTKEAQLSTNKIPQYVSVDDEAVVSTVVPSPDSGTQGTSVSYLSTKEAQLSTSEITQYVSVDDEAGMSTGVPSPDSGTQDTSVESTEGAMLGAVTMEMKSAMEFTTVYPTYKVLPDTNPEDSSQKINIAIPHLVLLVMAPMLFFGLIVIAAVAVLKCWMRRRPMAQRGSIDAIHDQRRGTYLFPLPPIPGATARKFSEEHEYMELPDQEHKYLELVQDEDNKMETFQAASLPAMNEYEVV